MTTAGNTYTYGPVPSRRLGRSLGMDLVPYKTCTYDCIYCQLGRTTDKTVTRREYAPAEVMLAELEAKLAAGSRPDIISLAGSGEPTLHTGIGNIIHSIKAMTPIPVAVLTNGSLLWIDEVQKSLLEADVVLPSLDAGDEAHFQQVNRPHQNIPFQRMIDGLADFRRRFQGQVWLEVFLLAGITGLPSEVRKIAEVARCIAPARIQLNTVCRPSAEKYALTMSTDQMLSAQKIFGATAEIISGSEQDAASLESTSIHNDGDILALLSRRPCTPDDVARGLGMHVIETLKHLETLAAAGQVSKIILDGKRFYVAGTSGTALKS